MIIRATVAVYGDRAGKHGHKAGERTLMVERDNYSWHVYAIHEGYSDRAKTRRDRVDAIMAHLSGRGGMRVRCGGYFVETEAGQEEE